ncbi:MAG: hypothetical protein ACE5GD_10605 [Candidatus Geothermarchaeales archaeon]
MNGMSKRVQSLNMLVSILLSAVISWIFYGLANQMAAQSTLYTYIDTIGGVGFVFILSMIISFSLVPSLVEKLFKRTATVNKR